MLRKVMERNGLKRNGRDRDRTDDLYRVKVALIPTELRARRRTERLYGAVEKLVNRGAAPPDLERWRRGAAVILDIGFPRVGVVSPRMKLSRRVRELRDQPIPEKENPVCVRLLEVRRW